MKMNKEKWVRPQAVVQTFVANEYIAACGESGTVYKFTCNAGAGVTHGRGYDATKYVWKVTTDSGEVLADEWSGLYGPCGTTHSAESNDEFLNGWIDDVYTQEDEHIPVVIWTEGGTNVHCTTLLHKEDWETEKS